MGSFIFCKIQSRYSRFKKEAKLRTPTEQIHRAVKEIRQRMNEMLKIVGHTERMKSELKQSNEGMSYLKRTRNALSNISEKLTELNNRIKGLTEQWREDLQVVLHIIKNQK